MKKLLAVLGGLAAAAAVIPFAHKKDAHSGEESFHALLWNAHISPDHTGEGKRDVTVNLGLTNPFAYREEFEHYDDEALLTSPAGETAPAEEAFGEGPSDDVIHF